LSELANLFAQFGIRPFLNYTQTLIVLIDSNGSFWSGTWHSAG